MKPEKTIEELTEYLSENLSYDGAIDSDYTCAKCGHRHQDITYWIDHKSALASSIASFLGFKAKLKSSIEEEIVSVLENTYVQNDKSDAPRVAKEIMSEIYGEQP